MKLRILLLAAGALLGACSDEPIAFQCEGFERFLIPVGATAGDRGGERTESAGDPLAEAIATSFGTQASNDGPPAPVNILILSGGGQWGAFGAGFMQGWSQ